MAAHSVLKLEWAKKKEGARRTAKKRAHESNGSPEIIDRVGNGIWIMAFGHGIWTVHAPIVWTRHVFIFPREKKSLSLCLVCREKEKKGSGVAVARTLKERTLNSIVSFALVSVCFSSQRISFPPFSLYISRSSFLFVFVFVVFIHCLLIHLFLFAAFFCRSQLWKFC